MRALSGIARNVLVVGFAGVLAGCAGSFAAPGAQGASAPFGPRGASIGVRMPSVLGTTSGAELFVSVPGAVVNAYTQKGKQLGQLTGFQNVGGLAVDGFGNLYVTDIGAKVIDVFAPGASSPTTVLSDGSLSPGYVAVGADGTVYASNVTNAAPATISVWPAGHTNPSALYSDPNETRFLGLTVDAHGNLFVAFEGASRGGVDKVPQGSSKPRNLRLQNVEVPIGLAIDNKHNVLVADAGDEEIKVFKRGSTTAHRTIFGAFRQPSFIAFDQNYDLLYVSDPQSVTVDAIDYTNNKVKHTVTKGFGSSYPWGVALSPAAQ